MVEGNSPEPREDLDARLRRARANQDQRSSPPTGGVGSPGKGLAIAVRIGTELVAAIAVGVGIGLLLDHWLGTAPWLLILFLLMGGAAGMLNVYRTVNAITLNAIPQADEMISTAERDKKAD